MPIHASSPACCDNLCTSPTCSDLPVVSSAMNAEVVTASSCSRCAFSSASTASCFATCFTDGQTSTPCPTPSHPSQSFSFTLGSEVSFLPTSPALRLLPVSGNPVFLSACNCAIVIFPDVGPTDFATSAAATTPTGAVLSIPFATTRVSSDTTSAAWSGAQSFSLLATCVKRSRIVRVSSSLPRSAYSRQLPDFNLILSGQIVKETNVEHWVISRQTDRMRFRCHVFDLSC